MPKAAKKPANKSPKPQIITGPSKSRRFGVALNIQFGEPGGSCQWRCVYCPWEAKEKKAKTKTTAPTIDEIVEELERALKKSPNVETVIVGGSSEPTLHPQFVELVEALKALKKRLKAKWCLVGLTSGIELGQSDIREACEALDEVWIKLDCAEEALFTRANRPAKAAGELKKYIAHIRKLKKPRLQTTLWRYPSKTTFQNWSAENLRGLLELYRQIKPATVHLTTIKKKELFAGLQPVNYEDMEAFGLRVSELGITVEVFP